MKDLKLWLSISNLRNVPHSLLLYSRIKDCASTETFEISDDEDEFEVLRRAESEIYFVEKMHVFEKTFGIDQLQAMIRKLEKQHQAKEYNPSEGKFIFDKADLNMYATVLDEFETRYTTMSDKIEHIYNKGNKMQDYLQKQIILDYHLRGDQSELEKEHPELAEMAKKYLGQQLYYELASSAGGEPLKTDSRVFKEIMQLSDELQAKFKQDMANFKKEEKEQ